MSYRFLFLVIVVVITASSCSSPNANDLPLTSSEYSTPIVTGLNITNSSSPDVIGIWGNPSDPSISTSIGSLPRVYTFLNPYPNPFAGQCIMNLGIPIQTNVDLWIVRARWIEEKYSDVLNSGGAIAVTSQRIAERELMRNRTLSAGNYMVQWDGRNKNGDFSSGGFYRIYFRANDVTYWHDVFLYREGIMNLPVGLSQYLRF